MFTVLNLYPYNGGHMLVCPYRHVADYTELDEGETAELADHTKRSIRACAPPPTRRASTSA